MLTFGFWQPILIFTLLNVIMTCGLYVTALSGQLSMATAALAGIGGYAAAVLTTNFDWPFLPAILAGCLLGAVTGMLLAALTVKMRDFILKLTTLAFGEAMGVIAFNIPYLGGANGFSGVPLYTTLGDTILGAAIAIYIAWRFDRSRLGFAARAVRDDPLAAAATGVSVRQVRIVTFTLGTALIAGAGGLSAHYVLFVTPSQMGFFFSLTYIIFLLCGGIQTLWGPLLATVLLTAAPEVLRFTDQFRLIVYGLLIVLVVLLRPEGLLTRRPTGPRRPGFPTMPRGFARLARALPSPGRSSTDTASE